MNWLLGILGAVGGGIAGYFLFSLFLSQGFYAMILPGALLGLGCGAMSRRHSIGIGLFAGIAALVLGIFLEWKFIPFAADDSLGYFLRNLHKLNAFTWIMIALGAACGYAFGKGRPGLAGAKQDSR